MSSTADNTRFSQTLNLRSFEVAETQQQCSLVRIYPAEKIGEVLALAGRPLVVGRDSSCEIELADDSVSRRHATIEPCGQILIVTDLDSTNGTYINDLRISQQTLMPGDRLRFGNQIFKFLESANLEAQYHEVVYKIMTCDGLTQAFNKRYLRELLEREVQRCQRTFRPLCAMMLDLDYFKRINDTYGHLTGDEVLVELCRRIGRVLRRDEVLARYGGEEFAIVLSDTTLDQACEVAERVRQAILERPFHTELADIVVTASVGVAETKGEPMTADELLELADQRLYAAKQCGRNRVIGG